MFKTLSLVIAAALAALLAFAATRPDSFRVERSITVAAPPEKIFPLINDLRLWAGWSPWEKMDPLMKRTHSGPPAGVGATYDWQGNKQVGTGRMRILQAAAPSQVVIQLDFLAPFEAHNTAEFTLTPQAGGTQVRWAMTGPSPYLAKLMHLFVSMDSMVGKDFEAGLQSLKALAEKNN